MKTWLIHLLGGYVEKDLVQMKDNISRLYAVGEAIGRKMAQEGVDVEEEIRKCREMPIH